MNRGRILGLLVAPSATVAAVVALAAPASAACATSGTAVGADTAGPSSPASMTTSASRVLGANGAQGSLPFTGGHVWPIALLGVALVAVGATLLLCARFRLRPRLPGLRPLACGAALVVAGTVVSPSQAYGVALDCGTTRFSLEPSTTPGLDPVAPAVLPESPIAILLPVTAFAFTLVVIRRRVVAGHEVARPADRV